MPISEENQILCTLELNPSQLKGRPLDSVIQWPNWSGSPPGELLSGAWARYRKKDTETVFCVEYSGTSHDENGYGSLPPAGVLIDLIS